MYYCLSTEPQLSSKLTEAIEALRREYDPTARFFKPHITIIFPTHERVGEQALIGHIEQVLSRWRPFEIQLGDFCKSRDFWLFLTLQKGNDDVKKLYRELHTGILDDGRDLNRFIPHLGLGLFLKAGAVYDWRNPRESDFDRRRYEEALRRAEALPLPESTLVEKLELTEISDTVVEWTTGKRTTLPEDSADIIVREFCLGQKSA